MNRIVVAFIVLLAICIFWTKRSVPFSYANFDQNQQPAVIKQHIVDQKDLNDKCVKAKLILNDTLYHRQNSFEICCVIISGGSSRLIYFLHSEGSPYGWYRAMAKRFLDEVAKKINANQAVSGVGIVVTEDDATLPPDTVKQLAQIQVPLMAHSIKRTSSQFSILIPDWHFIEHRGFENLIKTLFSNGKPFYERKESVYWRGSTTGSKFIESFHDSPQNISSFQQCSKLQRVAAVRMARSSSWLDFSLSRSLQVCAGNEQYLIAEKLLDSKNIHGTHNEVEWIEARGILEIDGNVHAWGSRWRMESGSVIFKIDSDYTSAYLDKAIPFTHFIPIAANLTDLLSVTKNIVGMRWSEEYRNIAKKSREFVKKFTFDNEVERVSEELSDVWGHTKWT